MNELIKKVDQIAQKKILILGDVGVDEYVMGGVKRISPEAPVPVLEVEKEESRLGLATNVAQNVSSLMGEPLLVSVVGDDIGAEKLRSLLKQNHVKDEHLIVDTSRPTTRKLRVMAHHHHLVRVDYEHRRYLDPIVEEKLLARVQELLPICDGVILQDYSKGVLSESLIQKTIAAAKKVGKKILVDPYRTTPLKYYRGADLMTPNLDEALQLVGYSADHMISVSDGLEEIGELLMQGLNSKEMVITRGKDGMSLFQNARSKKIPTFAREVFDVTGAGDTVIATLAMSWVSGHSLETACLLANYAAGVVVAKPGCVPCHVEELKSAILNGERNPEKNPS